MSKILYTDLFEYASDGAAQAVWITDASGLELDYMEYASDGAAQSAYVTSAGATYGSDVLTGGTATADDEYGDGYRAPLACDDNEGTYWVTGDVVTLPHWWKYDLGVAVTKTVRKLRIKPNGTNRIKDFTLQGSNNDSDWDTLHTGQHAENEDWEDYTFSNSTAYRYYKINITTNWRGDDSVGIKETEMMELSSSNLQCYSENSIINQGTYSLKAVATITDSLNETLTKSGLSIDLSGKNTLKFDVYASRTGTNLQMQIHDSGGTTSTKDIVISSATTWTEITWDISGISSANKDDIDSIIIKIINADSANTFYVDNFRSEVALQCYSENTIKQQGSYSLKVVAEEGGSLNKTLTKTIASDYLDYSVQDVIKLDVRASRTGSNIKLKMHDVGGDTQEHTINIASADIWQTESWDISGISGTKRDQIDKIIIEITNADAGNTIYIDNLYSKVVVEHISVWVG